MDIAGRLREPGPMVGVELRPPRRGLASSVGMDVWIDMHHAVRALADQNTFLLLTDNATGNPEEESLAHLAANIGDRADLGSVVPFLTCKHALEYCRMFVSRASVLGVGGVAVVGGDRSVGPDRCVQHSKDLRRILRSVNSHLPLIGWANPNADPIGQARYVADRDYCADAVFTQIVSGQGLGNVERFLAELGRLGVTLPVVFGVFLYRSANTRTLKYLRQYFPVPADDIALQFARGRSAEEICADSIRGLREIGAKKAYVSNVRVADAPATLERIVKLVDGGPPV